MEYKLCKNCKYFSEGFTIDICERPLQVADLVTGIGTMDARRARELYCGEKAFYFEERPLGVWGRLKKYFYGK